MKFHTSIHPSGVRTDAAPNLVAAAVNAGRPSTRKGGHPMALIVTGGAAVGLAFASPAWASSPADAGALPSPAYASQRAAEHVPSPTLGTLAQWAWAQRLERELCARYGDTSCS